MRYLPTSGRDQGSGEDIRRDVIALVKSNGERYVFLFDRESHETVQKTLARFAADPELSLTWYDAAILSQKLKALK